MSAMKKLKVFYQQMRMRHIYLKYAKAAIGEIVKREDYQDSFLREIRESYMLNTIPRLYKDNQNEELERCIAYAKVHGPQMYCYPEVKEQHYGEKDVFYDEEAGLYYVYWNEKRMYLKRSMSDKEKVMSYVNNSHWEQSRKSPHRYLDEEFQVSEGGVVLDIGGAEGNFSLSVIERASKIFVFECEEEWLEALRYTFREYEDKVKVIPKYVSKIDSDTEITLDTFARENKLQKIEMIKMDIEGAEIDVLHGATSLLSEKVVNKWAVCVYHRVDDAEKIEKILTEYEQKYAKGYIMSAVWRLFDLKYPYWVKGVMRATLKR